MSNRSLIEFNHDYAGRIEENKATFVALIIHYLRTGQDLNSGLNWLGIEVAMKASPTLFEKLASDIGLGQMVTEFQFAPPRKWRFDYAWPHPFVRVALEVEGGIWIHGRHTRGRGYEKDCEKYNEAVVMGWRLIRCTPAQRDDGSILETLRRLV